MEHFRHKKVLIVGINKVGFSLVNFFNQLACDIKVTDIRPIFDLNKEVKKLKKIEPCPQMTFGEHVDQDFLDADVVVYVSAVNPHLPQLELARQNGKEVYSEFALANHLCHRPIIAVAGSYGRTTVANMIGMTLKQDGKNVFVGGTNSTPFIDFCLNQNPEEFDYVVVEVSSVQMMLLENFHPILVVFTNLSDDFPKTHFASAAEYLETKLSIIKMLGKDKPLIVNYDVLGFNPVFRNGHTLTYWYSRRSFVKLGVMNEIQGTHFHEKRIHCNINYHSEFRVSRMRIVGQENREDLLAAITACKALNVSDKAIQNCIEKFPGIPHRLEFVTEKNGVCFYNDSKSESMAHLVKSIASFKKQVILIAGGKDNEDLAFDDFAEKMIEHVRVLVLVGESKERMNRAFVNHPQTYIVGSFEESVLFAYQKSRTGDVILLSPGNPATDFFRDYEERGNFFKKLVFQL